jgi:protocatechuate 3,4-dioxygenase beta subunit
MRRRRFLASSAAALAIGGLHWEADGAARVATPAQTAGPFYPSEFPADSDNDLVAVRGASAPARGEVTLLSGTVLDQEGRALPGARVEIWQCDANGRYLHPADRSGTARDQNFQGYGAVVTGTDGMYRFRTIKPVPYPGRAPHIHVAVNAPGARPLITQLYIAGHPQNARDGVLNAISDPQARSSVVVPFVPLADGSALAARFDIVLAA